MDLYTTLGRIALRYFPAIASWSIGVVGSVFLQSWSTWHQSGHFPSFESSLWSFLNAEARWISIALLFVSLLPAPQSILLGNQGVTGLAPIAPLVFVTACGMVCFSWIVINLMLGLARSLLPLIPFIAPDKNGSRQQRSLRQSVIHVCIVSCLIVFLIPYQVVFLICFVIQWVTCLSSGIGKYNGDSPTTPESPKKDKPNAFNQNVHILMFLLWLLPNMAPSLAVWVRTMATTGSVSLFTSDHWPNRVVPFLAVVELANARSPSPVFKPSRNRFQSILTRISLYAVPVLALLLGARYPYHVFDTAAVAHLALSTHAF